MYIRESGIIRVMLNIGTYINLLGHSIVGGCRKVFLKNTLSETSLRVQPFYYGSPGGAVIDLILEFSQKEKLATEI